MQYDDDNEIYTIKKNRTVITVSELQNRYTYLSPEELYCN